MGKCRKLEKALALRILYPEDGLTDPSYRKMDVGLGAFSKINGGWALCYADEAALQPVCDVFCRGALSSARLPSEGKRLEEILDNMAR